METERNQHSVRIREGLWAVFQTFHINLQDFVEKAIEDRAGLNGNLEAEILKRKEEIMKLQELNAECEKILKVRKEQEALLKMKEQEIPAVKKKNKNPPRKDFIVICPKCNTENMLYRSPNSVSMQRCRQCKFEIKRENFVFKEELKKP